MKQLVTRLQRKLLPSFSGDKNKSLGEVGEVERYMEWKDRAWGNIELDGRVLGDCS
jgi:hypothetical protein